MNYLYDALGRRSSTHKSLPRVNPSQHKKSTAAISQTKNKNEDDVPKFKTKDLLMLQTSDSVNFILAKERKIEAKLREKFHKPAEVND